MSWTTPVAGIAGTVITAAWSVANVVNPLNWLRQLTGNADPPGNDYVVCSDSTSTTSWKKVPATALAGGIGNSLLSAGAALANLGYTPVNKAGDTLTGALSFANTFGVTLQEASTFARTALRMSAADAIQLGNVNNGLNVLVTTLLLNGSAFPVVPAGAVVWFETLAELTTAGARWARYTAADGRMLIGAGTTFSQTFVQATSYGANWTPFTGAGVLSSTAADSGGTYAAGSGYSAPPHQHTVSIAAQTWLPVTRAGVYARFS